MKRMFIAALAALSLAAPVLITPASAASFGFGFGFGNDSYDHGYRSFAPLCLTDSQLRRAVRNRGYTNIYLNVAIGRHIQVRATKGSWVYLLDVNACDGHIYDRQRLRHS